MKIFLTFFLTIYLTTEAIPQVVKGKIVDENGDGLSSVNLQLYVNPDIYNATTSSDGSFIFDIVTGVEEGQIPSGYAVSNNFPNPFNPVTKIKYQLPKDNHVTIKVFNILGEEITTLVNESKQTGYYEIEFNGRSAAGGLASGVYLYRIEAGEFVSVKKMVLAK
jgi:hypothetical protein